MKANEEEAMRVRALLQTFENASGQKVNILKSSVFFNSNVIDSNRDRFSQVLRMVKADEKSTF